MKNADLLAKLARLLDDDDTKLQKLSVKGPYERLASARGGYDNSALTERGIRGIFFDALETTFDVTWASRVGLLVPSDAEVEKHRWLGQTPALREWIGGLLAQGMNDFEVQIENKDFEASIEVSLHDLRRDKTGHIMRRIGELAQRANNHWEEITVSEILSANPNAYNGQTFFNAAHVVGSSAAFANELTNAQIPSLNVTTPARPTKVEAALILQEMASHFFTAQDDKGRKANQGARRFLALVPPTMYGPFQAAVNDELVATGGTNELSNLGWAFDVVAEPLLTSISALQMYLFRVDAPASKPVILQSEVDPTIVVVGEDSEHAKKNNAVLWSARATRNVGPGEFRQALRGTLS